MERAWGMADNSEFVHLKTPPQFQASWKHRLFTLHILLNIENNI